MQSEKPNHTEQHLSVHYLLQYALVFGIVNPRPQQMQHCRAGFKLQPFGLDFHPNTQRLTLRMLHSVSWVYLQSTVKTSVPLMYLTFFFRISFFRWKWVVLAKEHIKTATCYTLFVILTRQHNGPSLFSFHHIKYFQQNLSTPKNPDTDRFPV